MDAQKLADAGKLAEVIGNDLQPLGGILRCNVCGRMEPLGDVGASLATGWPKCHGYTMTWWTQRQVDNGEMGRARVGR